MTQHKPNPVMSWSAEDSDEGPTIVVRFHDVDSFEVVSEFRYDNPQRLGGTADGTDQAARVLVAMLKNGFEAAVERYDLEMAMTPTDLTDVDLTVDMIISGHEGPEGS